MKMTAFAAAIAVAVGVGGIAHAQGYPSHPITMIVPFPAGGPTDTLARILSERMRLSLGQPVIIETVTGAGASIGVARAAQAAPDGYTLGIGNWTSHVGAGAMYPAAHDAVLELQPVSRISATPLMIIGKNALPPKNARELIAWLKADPGKASAATVGAGSAAHVCLLYFQQKTGTLTYVDTAAGVRFASTKIMRVRMITRRRAQISGTGSLGSATTSFTAVVADGGKGRVRDTFSISLASGYRRAGRLLSGGVTIR